MVDLSKHLERVRQAIDRRNYDLALEVSLECQEIDPYNLDNYKLLLDAAKRRQREGGKKGFKLGFSLSSDPHKKLSACVRKAAFSVDMKSLKAAGDAAAKIFAVERTKAAAEVAALFYEEAKGTGLFNESLLWDMANVYFDRYKQFKDFDCLDLAIERMKELQTIMPKHPEAGRTLHAWQATWSSESRNRKTAGAGRGDYRSDLADEKEARRNEVLNRRIRTRDDAKEALEFINEDIKGAPKDKNLWIKRGDILMAINEWAKAREAYQKAQEIDSYDFMVTMRIGDANINEVKDLVREAKTAGQPTEELEARLLDTEVIEYTKRTERQPMEMAHRYNLGVRYFKLGEIDRAAAEFQKALGDPKFKMQGHRLLGHCFAKKNLLDLAIKQYTSCLSLIIDEMSADYKEVLYNRARLYESSGNKGEAIMDYTALVQIDLGYRDAAQRLSQLQSSS